MITCRLYEYIFCRTRAIKISNTYQTFLLNKYDIHKLKVLSWKITIYIILKFIVVVVVVVVVVVYM